MSVDKGAVTKKYCDAGCIACKICEKACPEKAITVAAISGLLAALLQGMTDFIWFNYRIFFFFWVAAALISASSRIGMKKIKLKNDF